MKVLNQAMGQNWALYHGDACEVIKGIPDNTIHYSIFSPPFASLYTYSNSDRDMGNSKGEDEFYIHFNFLISELYRVTMPGRLISFHCMDIPAMKERDGYIGLKDFPGEIIRAFCGSEAEILFKARKILERLNLDTTEIDKAITDASLRNGKFIYHSRTTIWKDPLIEATRTKALGLMHKQLVKDSAMCRNGLPDYLITVRKPGENPEPIAHPNGFESFVGIDEPDAPKKEATLLHKDAVRKKMAICKKDPVYSHHVWRRYASPVWMDIDQSNTLQKESAREEADERHICPLQLEVIERGLILYTNPGDTVLSPFAGIGSEGFVAVKTGRRFVGIELKESYYNQAVLNIQRAEREKEQPTLFDLEASGQ